jgi:GT2 family glycosyltransferase
LASGDCLKEGLQTGNGSLAVCVVFLNKAQQTAETIDSFAGSGLPVYVLNNGSAAIAAESVKGHCLAYPNVKYIESRENVGCGGGRNILAKQAEEEWLFFVDNDITICSDCWLKNLQTHIRHSRDIDAFVPRIRNAWDNTWVRQVRLVIEDGKGLFLDLRSEFTNVFPGGGSVVNRRTLERLGYYDEELMAFEDFEIALRAIVNGRELCVKHTQDIELVHDHRVVRSPEDHQAVTIRYDVERVGKAHDRIERVYGVSFDKNYAGWLQKQIRDMTEPRRTKAVWESVLSGLLKRLRS